MVYFIKSTESFGRNVSKIAKAMINIEQNKNIFNADGEIINDPEPFNSYTFNGIEYEMSISVGIISIYSSNNDILVQMCINHLIDELNSIIYDRFSNTSDAVKYNDSTNTNHTILSIPTDTLLHGTNSSVFGTSYRKILSNYNDIRKCKDNKSRFIWLVNNNSPNIQTLYIPELSNSIPQQEFLMRSVSTIIFDQINLFNVACNTKQLDYPCMRQYTIFKQNRLIDSVLTISESFGLSYEIVNCYNFKIKIARKNFLYDNSKLKFVDYNNVKLKRVDESKDWITHIKETFDFDAQEKLELQSEEIGKPAFPIDICFISRVPLYKHAYVVEVGLLDIRSNPSNITNILVSPAVFSSMIIDNSLSPKLHYFINYFTIKTGYTVLNTYITKFARTEIEAIELIPRDNISDERRNLLRCISLNGCFWVNEHYPKTLITVDREKKIMYAGFKDICDKRIIEYMNSNTILFAFEGI